MKPTPVPAISTGLQSGQESQFLPLLPGLPPPSPLYAKLSFFPTNPMRPIRGKKTHHSFKWPSRGHQNGNIACFQRISVPEGLMPLTKREKKNHVPAAGNVWNRGHRACPLSLQNLKQRERRNESTGAPTCVHPVVSLITV